MDAAQFAGLQRLTSEPDALVWLARGGGPGSDDAHPHGDMVPGLAKVVRQENPAIRFLTLALEQVRSPAAVAETVLTVVDSVLARRPRLAPDHSYWEAEDGVLHICRLVEEGGVRELTPITSFSFGRVQEAFRYMQGRPHSGKMALYYIASSWSEDPGTN